MVQMNLLWQFMVIRKNHKFYFILSIWIFFYGVLLLNENNSDKYIFITTESNWLNFNNEKKIYIFINYSKKKKKKKKKNEKYIYIYIIILV